MVLSRFDASYEIQPDHLPALMELFASAWWTAQRTTSETRRILTGSDVLVAITHRESGRLGGFARVLTDDVCLAVIMDVIAAPDMRGAGVGTAIMDAVLGHPRLAEVRSIELVCQPELMAFYRRWGFTHNVGRSRLMRRTAELSLLGEPTAKDAATTPAP